MTLTPNLIACLAIGGGGGLPRPPLPMFQPCHRRRRHPHCPALHPLFPTDRKAPAALLRPDRGNCDTLSLPAKAKRRSIHCPGGIVSSGRCKLYRPSPLQRRGDRFQIGKSFPERCRPKELHRRAERHLSRPAGTSSPEHGGNGTGDLAAGQQAARSLRPNRPPVCLHRPRGIQGERGRHPAAVRRRRAGGAGYAGRRIVFIIGENDFPRQHCTKLFGVFCTALP